MQNLSRSTPSTILRKRNNKENEERDARRNKLRSSRRVSFAPDDELHTMHLYKKDNSDRDDLQLTPDDSLNDLRQALPYSFNGFHPSQTAALESPAPQGYHASSPMATPLSMDLTNNSFSMHGQHGDQGGLKIMSHQPPMDDASMPGPAVMPPPISSQEYTRNITNCIPALSTLVEEDEDMGLENSPDAREHPAAAYMSPISPFVLEEMRLEKKGSHEEDTEDLKHKWGFTPGAEDTLNVTHGRQVMGEATYNNVYGNSTMGDITRSMKPSHGTGVQTAIGVMQLQRAPPGSAPPASPTQPPPPPQQHQFQATITQPPQQQHQFMPEMTLNLLEEDQQTAAWRQPAFGTGHASVASNKLGFNSMHKGLNETTGVAGMPTGNYTAQLLADQTQTPHGALQEMMARYQQPGQQVAGSQRQVAGSQRQLAGQEADIDAEHVIQQHGSGDGRVTGRAALLGDPTAASSSAMAAMQTDRSMHAPMSATKAGQPQPGSSTFGEPADHGGPAGGLADLSLTLDDFAVPPELPYAVAQAQNQPSQHELLQSFQTDQPLQGRPAAVSSRESARGAADVFVAAGRSAEGVLSQQAGLDNADVYRQQQSQQQQQGLSPYIATRGQDFGGRTPYLANHNQASLMRSPYVASWNRSEQQQQHQQHIMRGASLPPISFPEFLQLIEVRFLDDMRRRTSIIQAGLGGDSLSQQADAAALQSTADILEALYVAGPRISLTQRVVDELAARVEAMQTRVGRLQADMARSNPPVFAAVQLATSSDLERLQDEMKLVKRMCRLRAMMSWKQQRIQFEQELSTAYRGMSTQALQEEVQAMEASLQAALKLEEEAHALQAKIGEAAQQEKAQLQAALEQRQTRSMQLRQLQELQASNDQRDQRLKAAEQQLAVLKGSYEDMLQEKLSLQQQLQPLRAEAVQHDATPGAKKTPSKKSSPLVHALLQKQEQLEVVLGLQGLQLDAKDVVSKRSVNLMVANRFRVRVQLPGSGPRAASGTCKVSVQLLPQLPSGSLCAPVLLPSFESICQGTLCSSPLAMPQLQSVMDRLLVQLSHASNITSQLDALLLSLPLFVRVQHPESSSSSSSNEAGQASPRGNVQLVFINVETTMRVQLVMSWEGLLHILSNKPDVEVEVGLPPAAQAAKAAAVAAIRKALQAVPPGPTCLQQLCCTVHDMLQEARQ